MKQLIYLIMCVVLLFRKPVDHHYTEFYCRLCGEHKRLPKKDIRNVYVEGDYVYVCARHGVSK